MAQRLSQVEFVQQLKNRPRGVSEEEFVKGLLKSGQVTDRDLYQWKASAAVDNAGRQVVSRDNFNLLTRGMTVAQRDAKAAELQQKGAVIDGYRPPEERERRYEESMKRGDEPSMVRHPSGWWKWHTPNEKQQILNNTGEFAGGTLGGIAGGVASGGNPAVAGVTAGGGAVAGKETARALGRAAGIDSDDHTSLGDMAQTFIVNGAGEAFGSTPAWALSKMKPTARAAEVAKLWDQMGLPMTLARRSGNDFLAQMESGVGHIPLVGRIVKKSNAAAYDALEGFVENHLNGISPDAVSREELADLVRQGMGAARQSFNASMDAELARVARNVHPSVQSARSAGLELQKGQAKNQASLKAFGDANYPRLIEEGQDYAIAGEPLATLMDEWSKVSPSVKELLPNKVKGVYGKLDAGLGADGVPKIDVPGGQMPIPLITAGDALEMRRELNGIIRGTADAKDRAALGRVRDALQSTIETAPKSWVDDVNAVNAAYGDTARKVSSEVGSKSTNLNVRNNPQARSIALSREPEALANGLVKPDKASQIELADTATNRGSVAGVDPDAWAGTPLRPVNAVGAYSVDRLGQESNSATGRTSPGWLKKRLDTPGWEPTYKSLIGDPNYSDLQDVARPGNISAEDELYNSGLARAADKPTEAADPVFREMFPKKSSAAVTDQNLSYLPAREEGERALADDIISQSRSRPGSNRQTRSTGYGTESMLDAGKMKGQLDQYGDTVDHVLGPNADGLRDTQTALSQMQEPVAVWGNSSGTSHASAMIAALTHPLHTAAMIPSLAVGIPAAKGLVSPRFGKLVTDIAKTPMASQGAQRFGGALVRGLDFTQSAPKERPVEGLSPKPSSGPPPIPGEDDQPKAAPVAGGPPPIPGEDPLTADDWAKKHLQ